MQNNNHHIPESELELAQRVGTVLEEGRSVLSIDDPLMDQIVDHKKDLYSKYEAELAESKRNSWKVISGAIQKDLNEAAGSNSDESSIRTVNFRRSTFLKVAAAIVFGVLISVIYLQFNFDQPTIVAQSGLSQITYTLNDESRVQLRPNSTLSIVEQSDAVVRYKLEGEAFFDVTRDQNRRFLVDTGTGQIEVTGTSFNVREWGGKTVVYLKDGSLSLSSSNKMKEVLLKPGEMATVSSGSNITDPVSTDGQEYISWQNDELILNDRTVASVINELEYHYSIEIRAPEELKNEVLGGTLSLESKEVSLENLGIVLGGKFSSIGEDSFQFVE